MAILSHAQDIWDDLRSSWWFVPSVMAVAAMLLALLTTAIDTAYSDTFEQGFGLYAGGVEGTRAVLETVASSMITVAGVAFSIAIVVMTLASSQYGPRLLRSFMRDLGSQVSLGTFVGMFIFNVLVLRMVRSEPEEFVPHLSVTVGMLLTLASLGVFIYFIHHAARSIQVSHILDSVGHDLRRITSNLYPSNIGEDGHDARDAQARAPAAVLAANQTGYVQIIEGSALMAAAAKHDVVIELTIYPGTYVIDGGMLARVRPADSLDEQLAGRIRSAIVIGSERTEQQDAGFGLQQLQQLCLRALSPALNDPLTATMCIDRISAELVALAGRPRPEARRVDGEGRLRVIAAPVTLEAMLDTAYGEIRRSARRNVTASIRLLDSLAVIASRATRSDDRAAATEMARLIVLELDDETLTQDDLRRVAEAGDRVE